MRKIKITVENITLLAELNDSPTADEIFSALPLESVANTWGDEIYFSTPLRIQEAPDARTDVEVNTLGFWPIGRAFCIFFGPTPASDDNNPRAASPVNVFGRVINDATQLRDVRDGAMVKVEKADNN